MVHDISIRVVVRQRVAQRKFFFKVDVLLTYTQKSGKNRNAGCGTGILLPQACERIKQMNANCLNRIL